MPKEAKGGQRVLQPALADVRLWLKSRPVTSWVYPRVSPAPWAHFQRLGFAYA